MDVVLGMSMAPTTVQMVLVEGENADGVIVDQDDFATSAGPSPPSSPAPDQVVSAILGTRQSAVQGGLRLTSAGVAVGDDREAAVLRDALARHKLESVMLVSTLLAAAALAQAVGAAIGYGYTALMLVEPETTTLAVVDVADGAILGVQQQQVGAAGAVAALADAVASLRTLDPRPDGVFLIGSGVDVTLIKQQLEATTPLPVSAPEEPRLALARGAALASAHAPLFSSSTAAVAYAQDPGTGAVRPGVLPSYADYNAADGEPGLAYSAVPPTGVVPTTDPAMLDFGAVADRPQNRPLAWAGGAVAIFVVGLVTLVVALALGIRPHSDQRPDPGGNVVAPSQQAPPPRAPTPGPAAPAPAHPAPQPAPPAAPPPAAPPPPPELPPPPALPQVPIPIPKIPGPDIPGPKFPGPKLPGLPGIPGIPGL